MTSPLQISPKLLNSWSPYALWGGEYWAVFLYAQALLELQALKSLQGLQELQVNQELQVLQELEFLHILKVFKKLASPEKRFSLAGTASPKKLGSLAINPSLPRLISRVNVKVQDGAYAKVREMAILSPDLKQHARLFSPTLLAGSSLTSCGP